MSLKLGVCDVCKRNIIREEYSDYTIEGCSDFCATVSLDEKMALKDLQEGDYAVWPCSECGCAIEDEYVPGGHCSTCSPKIKLREKEKQIAILQKELEFAKNEAVLWKSEAQKAYEFNKKANDWWNFKLERIRTSGNKSISLPWKMLAKTILKRETQILDDYDKLRASHSALIASINGPKSANFVNSMLQESIYQQNHRYDFDRLKPDIYWPWLIGASVAKALINTNNTLNHNLIEIAAAAYNWWKYKNKENPNE